MGLVITLSKNLGVLCEFHKLRKIPNGCNSSFLNLISININPQNFGEYHLISFIGCLYKIISKCLARILKEVIHPIIVDNQSGFIRGKNMTDGVVVANETIDFVRKNKSPSVLLKVDFEKAYDSIN
jgi:hypothetical protein